MDNNKMTRRSALKRMGAAVMSAAAASSGLFSLTSCERKRIILYFTGTGNCLHVARELADENTTLLSIPQRAHIAHGHKISQQSKITQAYA